MVQLLSSFLYLLTVIENRFISDPTGTQPRAGMHNIRPAKAYNLARKAQNYVYLD